tara:strand:- start:981 stop:1208 length:228 start_codon:yes stop_codon:yes gene_type:complete
MSLFSVFLLFSVATIIFFSYLIINLNNLIVSVDFLFFDLEIELGLILLVFFLAGSLMALILEFIYFAIKRNKGND